jgi:hypothetical protein
MGSLTFAKPASETMATGLIMKFLNYSILVILLLLCQSV